MDQMGPSARRPETAVEAEKRLRRALGIVEATLGAGRAEAGEACRELELLVSCGGPGLKSAFRRRIGDAWDHARRPGRFKPVFGFTPVFLSGVRMYFRIMYRIPAVTKRTLPLLAVAVAGIRL